MAIKTVQRFKKTPVGMIPEDWGFAKGEMIFAPIKGKPPSELIDQQKPGYLPYVSNEYLREDMAMYAKPTPDTALTQEDDIILLWDGSNAGEVFLAKPGILSSTMALLEIKDKGKFEKKYIYYSLKAKEATLQRTTKGTGVPHVDGQLLSVLPFAVPSLKEQEKIAAVLSSVDLSINITRKVIEQVRIFKKGLMQELFTCGLPGKHKRFKKTKIGTIPVEWRVSSIGNECDIQTGATPLRSNGSYHLNGTVPWVKTTDLNNSDIEKTEESITEDAISNTNCKKIQKGALLVAMYGGFNQIGRTGILRIEAATNQALAAILPSQNIRVEFLNLYLITHREKWMRIAGSSRKDPNITKKDVEEFLIPIVPVDEQNEIVKTITLIDSNLKSLRLLLERYSDFKTALMQVLLTGKVRVNCGE